MGVHCATCTCDPVEANASDWRDVALVVGGLCPAGADIGEGTPLATYPDVRSGKQRIDCLIRGHHDGPHQDRIIDPCPECGGWDEHTGWCVRCVAENEWWWILQFFAALFGFRDLAKATYRHVLRFEMHGPKDEPVYWIESVQQSPVDP